MKKGPKDRPVKPTSVAASGLTGPSHAKPRCSTRPIYLYTGTRNLSRHFVNEVKAAELPGREGLKLFDLQQLATTRAHHNYECLSPSRTLENVKTAIATSHLYILKRIVLYSGLSPFARYRAAPRKVGFRFKRRFFGAAACLPLIEVACAPPQSFLLRVNQRRLHETIGC
jgi:hypothetical protein